jgi:RecA-family ATPase
MTEPTDVPFPGEVITPDDQRWKDAERRKAQRKAKSHNKKGNGHTEPLEPLRYLLANDDPIPPREWIVEGHIPAGNVSLMSGEGAIGKSILAMQLAAVMALNAISDHDRDWLGMLPKGGCVLYVSCEEDDREAERRLDRIAVHYGSKRSVLLQHLHLTSWVNEDKPQLMVLDRKTDALVGTRMLERLIADVARLKPDLIILDTVADLFGGSEIRRDHTRQFISRMRHLALMGAPGAGVLMLTHPSLEGIRSGSGLSGSTAWHNSCRARCVLKKFAVKQKSKRNGGDPGDEEPSIDNDLRVLEWLKNNYGPPQSTSTVRWQDGVYVVQGGGDSLVQQARFLQVEHLFIDLLRERNAQSRHVFDKPGRGFAPAIFAESDEAKGVVPRVTAREFSKAMDRLFKAKRIVLQANGPPSRNTQIIVEGLHVV